MTSAARLLTVWLSPAVWLGMSALIFDRGPGGLWIGLGVTLAPLIALGVRARSPEPLPESPEPLFPVVILLLTVGGLLWANIALAGDVSAWLGAPRWYGIAIAATTAWALTVWRGASRVAAALGLVALCAVSAPLGNMARAIGAGPVGAWERLAAQPAFRFPPSSPWVTAGRDLAMAGWRAPIVFDEEHRIAAPAGGRLRARTVDGNRVAEIEWELAAGQSVTLRPGDQIVRTAGLRLAFEADKRVPGAPRSGTAWADRGRRDGPRVVGLMVTLLLGAMVLLRSGVAVPTSRATVAAVGGGLVVAFLWAQAWAVYAALRAPDLFLGGVTPERLLDARALGLGGGPWRVGLQALLLMAGLAGFLASSEALRARLGAMDRTGGGEIGHDLGLWAGVFGIAGVVSLWPVDPWALILVVLGGAASALGPAMLWPPSADRAGTGTAAGLVGLVVFAALAVLGRLGAGTGLVGAALAFPAVLAAPAGALALWIARLAAGR